MFNLQQNRRILLDINNVVWKTPSIQTYIESIKETNPQWSDDSFNTKTTQELTSSLTLSYKDSNKYTPFLNIETIISRLSGSKKDQQWTSDESRNSGGRQGTSTGVKERCNRNIVPTNEVVRSFFLEILLTRFYFPKDIILTYVTSTI